MHRYRPFAPEVVRVVMAIGSGEVCAPELAVGGTHRVADQRCTLLECAVERCALWATESHAELLGFVWHVLDCPLVEVPNTKLWCSNSSLRTVPRHWRIRRPLADLCFEARRAGGTRDTAASAQSRRARCPNRWLPLRARKRLEVPLGCTWRDSQRWESPATSVDLPTEQRGGLLRGV